MPTIDTTSSITAVTGSRRMLTDSGVLPSVASRVEARHTGSSAPPGHTFENATKDSTSEPDIAASGSQRVAVRARRDIGAIAAKARAGSSGMRTIHVTSGQPFSRSIRSSSTVLRRR